MPPAVLHVETVRTPSLSWWILKITPVELVESRSTRGARLLLVNCPVLVRLQVSLSVPPAAASKLPENPSPSVTLSGSAAEKPPPVVYRVPYLMNPSVSPAERLGLP